MRRSPSEGFPPPTKLVPSVALALLFSAATPAAPQEYPHAGPERSSRPEFVRNLHLNAAFTGTYRFDILDGPRPVGLVEMTISPAGGAEKGFVVAVRRTLFGEGSGSEKIWTTVLGADLTPRFGETAIAWEDIHTGTARYPDGMDRKAPSTPLPFSSVPAMLLLSRELAARGDGAYLVPSDPGALAPEIPGQAPTSQLLRVDVGAAHPDAAGGRGKGSRQIRFLWPGHAMGIVTVDGQSEIVSVLPDINRSSTYFAQAAAETGSVSTPIPSTDSAAAANVVAAFLDAAGTPDFIVRMNRYVDWPSLLKSQRAANPAYKAIDDGALMAMLRQRFAAAPPVPVTMRGSIEKSLSARIVGDGVADVRLQGSERPFRLRKISGIWKITSLP